MRLALVIPVCVFAVALTMSSSTAADSSLPSLKRIEDRCFNESCTHNGDNGIRKYKVDAFDIGEAAKELKESVSGSDCRFNIVVGRRENIRALKDKNLLFESAWVGKEVEALYKRGLIKTIISAQWDGSSGDGEYCSSYKFDVYTTDGYLLYFDFNYTD